MGEIYPPRADMERLAKYTRGRSIFQGRQYEVYERATSLLKNTPHAAQLKNLYIAVNIMDVLLTKPADLLVGEPPVIETGQPDENEAQKALSRIVEENDLTPLLHEMTIANGYRGDAWLKVYHGMRQDFSELQALGLPLPTDVQAEPIVESVNPMYVFPEMARGSRKKFKAVNIAYVEYEDTRRLFRGTKETPFLHVERHIPGYILFEKYRLTSKGVETVDGVPIPVYVIEERVATGKAEDVVETGVPRILLKHIPYKAVDERYEGISGVEKLESVLTAISDRIVQIDYILWKHSDPTAYGPRLEGTADTVQTSGMYIPLEEKDKTPGYMTFLSSQQLDGSFKELDYLLSLVYQMSETPQWLFGTTLTGKDGGTGTSHSDGGAIRARFMPILSKVNRIRTYVDRALRDALYDAQELELFAKQGVDGFVSYDPIYPLVHWKDGIPVDEKLQAEVMSIRTANQPTLDMFSAIKKMDGLNDEQTNEVIDRIKQDSGFVDASIFNTPAGGQNGAVVTSQDPAGGNLSTTIDNKGAGN